jgi:hypothetical protein
MAFDKSTRNRLARFVADARGLIAEEFTQQFQSLYGISPEGVCTPLEKLTHLDEIQLATAALLRGRIDYLVKTHPDDRNGTQAAVARLAREQAFTILNRFAAIRMTEKRGLIVESIGKGYQSKGFKVYETVTGNGLGETYQRYRLFLFCLFDEFAVDLGVLFDRHSPQALLFPREQALLALLELINHSEIEPLWAEDETIGWIYQYYNDPEERKKMRAESAAPRNSRELAVRNQFFTPRYVVEFLTDNTLGRIWYEMTRGQTRLAEQCRYLVRRPTEIFLAEGETAPKTPDQEGLSQEELLRQPVQIPHRPLKDPREIRLLDPACGSMHFGLYAFDLFETIYEEAWDNGSCPALQDAYASKDEFLKDVPRLIIEHNVHGIDIDPRAVQIAGLSLWLRAQKAWQQQKVPAADRPRVRRSNIVCAEPMPGSPEMLEEFVATLKPDLLGELVKTVFDKMQLAGEAGSLLKIEEEIRTAIDIARKEWLKQQEDLLTRKDGSQKEFFNTAEQQVIEALRTYAEQAEAGSYQRRLFADDAARGFAFIDLCRKRYDAVVMNPPFGEFTDVAKAYAKVAFAESGEEIDAAFVDRGVHLLAADGKTGVIANRTQLFKGVLEQWRVRNFRTDSHIDALVDLGYGVLDGAVVEAAAFALSRGDSESSSSMFVRALDADDKAERLLSAVRRDGILPTASSHVFLQESCFFESLPAKRIAYWITRPFADAFVELSPLEGNYGYARQGLASADNFRFVRLAWEVSPIKQFGYGRRADSNAKWFSFAKGGEYTPFFQDLHLVINYEGEGQELTAFPGSVIRNPSFYLKPALTYSERTASGFSPRALPAGCLFDSKGPIVAPASEVNASALLAFLMSRPAASFLEFLVAAGDSAVSGTAARQYTQSIVGSIPVPSFKETDIENLEGNAQKAWAAQAERDSFEETGRLFTFCPTASAPAGDALVSIKEMLLNHAEVLDDLDLRILQATWETERIVRQAYGFDDETEAGLDSEFGAHPLSFSDSVRPDGEFSRLLILECDQVVKELIERVGGGRSITKKCYFANRKVELLSQYFGVNARLLYDVRRHEQLIPPSQIADEATRLISFITGTTFGRWDIRYATGERQPPELPDPFEPLPVCQPGMLQSAEGLPAEPKDVPAGYPLRISWPGILVDDENHPEDIVARVREAIEVIWKDRAEAIEQEACGILGVKTLRDYFRRPAAFFADHLKRYSKSRRQAPIYWPLSTKSGSYTLWLYYHRLTDQTLHTCLADFLDPKIRKVQSELDALTASGGGGTRASDLREFLDELKDLRDEIECAIKLPWKPNLNDGVLITASPLHKLFRLPKWQKDLKACWDKLAKGDYDWAHLAHTIWPQRVEKACEKDRSIAIAHGLEHLCKVEPPKPNKKRGKKAAEEESEEPELIEED